MKAQRQQQGKHINLIIKALKPINPETLMDDGKIECPESIRLMGAYVVGIRQSSSSQT